MSQKLNDTTIDDENNVERGEKVSAKLTYYNPSLRSILNNTSLSSKDASDDDTSNSVIRPSLLADGFSEEMLDKGMEKEESLLNEASSEEKVFESPYAYSPLSVSFNKDKFEESLEKDAVFQNVFAGSKENSEKETVDEDAFNFDALERAENKIRPSLMDTVEDHSIDDIILDKDVPYEVFEPEKEAVKAPLKEKKQSLFSSFQNATAQKKESASVIPPALSLTLENDTLLDNAQEENTQEKESVRAPLSMSDTPSAPLSLAQRDTAEDIVELDNLVKRADEDKTQDEEQVGLDTDSTSVALEQANAEEPSSEEVVRAPLSFTAPVVHANLAPEKSSEQQPIVENTTEGTQEVPVIRPSLEMSPEFFAQKDDSTNATNEEQGGQEEVKEVDEKTSDLILATEETRPTVIVESPQNTEEQNITLSDVETTPVKKEQAQEPQEKKEEPVFKSVMERLEAGEGELTIFGDGTALVEDEDKDNESIFSRAFEEKKEVVKVGFASKRKKQGFFQSSQEQIMASAYFAEDKEFMSKVDEAWFDQGTSSSRWLIVVFSSLILFFVVWASFASIDEVARGQGQVIPSQRMQLLQHLEGGILNEVLVTEGDTVEPGQILARVDNVSAESLLKDTETRIIETTLALIRLDAELQGVKPVFPEQYYITAPDIVAAQEQTYNSRALQQESNIGISQEQLEQKRQELNESLSRKLTFENALELVQKRIDLAKPLVARKIYPEVDYLNLQQEAVRIQGDIDAVVNSIAKIESSVKEMEGRLDLSSREYESEIMKERNVLRAELASLEQNKAAGADRVTRTELRSQVRGIVNRILLNTKGGVVRPGESIMEIVPLDDTLVVETKVRPQDIAFIHPNQKAIVRITAYDSSIYGNMEGKVEQISADTITNEKGDIFFLVKVRTNDNAIHHNGEDLPIMPGMVATVDILTGKKTVLTYLLKPITKASQYALKER